MVARDITSDLNRNCRAIDDVAPHKIHNSNLVNPQKKHKKNIYKQYILINDKFLEKTYGHIMKSKYLSRYMNKAIKKK